MVNRKGLGQANILRTNNNTSTGYGIVYADEVSGHRTVANLTALYALHDWQLSASGDNTDNDAIGQLWYVVNADGNGNGCYYQLKDWSKRNEAAGWSEFKGTGASTAAAVTFDNTASGMTAVNAQGAIEELNVKKFAKADIVQESGNSEELVMSQKAVSDKLKGLSIEIIYDVSARNGGAVFESISALLNSPNLGTLIPTSVRHGGMSIRFVQSSDNKYVQYRLMANTFSTTVADWQGVDDEPTTRSNNLVKSGGVEKRLYDIDGLSTYVDKKGINAQGVISDNNSFFISIKIPIKSGDTIFWKYSASAILTMFCVFDQNDNSLGAWNGESFSNGQRTFTIIYETASYAIASFDRNSDYTPLVKVNGEIVWTKREKGAIELINEKIVTDNFPSFRSNNLVKSNGIFIDSIYTKANIDNIDIKEAINNNRHDGYVDKLGTVKEYNGTWFYSDPILLKAGYTITTVLTDNNNSTLSIAQGDSVNVGDILTPINSKTYKATEDVYIVISGKTSDLLNKQIYIKNENAVAPFIGKIDKDFYGIGNTVRNKYIVQGGAIYNDNNSNIIIYEVNQNDSIRWVRGALSVDKSPCLCLFDREDNYLDYWTIANGDSRDIDFVNYPNAHHIIASFGKFLVNGDENATPLVINEIGIKSVDRTSKGTYDTVKELNKKVSEIYTEPYDEYGVIGINYPSEVKKVIEDIDKNTLGTKLHFCHISDNHGGGFGYANEFTDLSPAKFLVNTGDLILDKFSDSFDEPKGLILAMNKPGFIVLGNHDVYKSTSLQDRFEKYFAPINEHNGLTGNTKTYYSVDYSQEKVKCIFLDIWDDMSGNEHYLTSENKMSSEQINWFAQELINAKSNNLHVACFVHISPDYVNYEKSPIDFYDFQVEKAAGVSFLCDMIDKFIEGGTVTFTHNEQEYTFSFVAGGHFVGWFCGHMHSDCSGWMLNHPKQFSISVPRPGWKNDWDSQGEDGTFRVPKLGITFNYVTIDTKFQRLSILRIGNNKTIWGTPREGFSIRYN